MASGGDEFHGGVTLITSKRIKLTALLLALAVLGGCSFGMLSSKKRVEDVEVVVLFTGNTNGELVPCG
jgi:hypothetical protein